MNQVVVRLVGALAISIFYLSAARAAPANLGAGLREMVMQYEAHGPAAPATEVAAKRSSTAAMRSASDAVRRDVHGHVAVTSQGTAVLHTGRENMKGITGAGITVAALSNSYNISGGPITA